MNSKIIAIGIIKAVIALALLIFFLWGMYQLKTLFIYLILAGVLTLIFNPLQHFFTKKLRMKNTLSALCILFLILLIVGGIISLFIPLLISQGRNFSTLDFEKINQNIYFFLENLGVDTTSISMLKMPDFVNVKNISHFFNNFLILVSDFGMGAFSVCFISFFFLKDGNKIISNILSLFSDTYKETAQQVLESIKQLLSRYFIGLLFQMIIIFVILTAILLIFGVKDALVIAFFCALLNLIPYLGPVIGAIFISVLTMSSFINEDFALVILPKTLYVLGGFALAQFIDNFVSQPIIFSNSVKSHPLEIFLVILVAGTLFGVVGMIAAIPLYTVIKVILKALFSENKLVKLLTKNL